MNFDHFPVFKLSFYASLSVCLRRAFRECAATGLSQSTVSKFELAKLTRDNMARLRPVLEDWLQDRVLGIS